MRVSKTNSNAASNISLLTTVQSPIAIELDAFDCVTWFASTYLVRAIQGRLPLYAVADG
jgi:hypothetical protein